MLTARVSVAYRDDWTEAIGDLEIGGDIYTATLHRRRYMGLLRLYGDRVEEALALVHDADYHESVDVVGRTKRSATVLVTAELTEKTPFTVMLENGYMPLDPTVLRRGREYFDLIIRNRERLLKLVDRLEAVGEVAIERVVSDVELPAQPNPVAWSHLLDDLTDRQLEVLTLAVDRGYFSVPREVTLTDLASDLDLQKSTVGEHLQRALGHLAAFTVEGGSTSRRYSEL